MSKKNRKQLQEIPQLGNALEVPNYVTPTDGLGPDLIGADPRLRDLQRQAAQDCGMDPEDCRR